MSVLCKLIYKYNVIGIYRQGVGRWGGGVEVCPTSYQDQLKQMSYNLICLALWFYDIHMKLIKSIDFDDKHVP